MRQEFLLVVPNPWTHIDTDGQTYAFPAGFVLHDPAIIPPALQSRVGCVVADVTVIGPAKFPTVNKQKAFLQRHRIRYEAEPLRVNNTRYYRDEIKQGHLFAANETTAIEAGITEFISPVALLQAARFEAIVKLRAENPDAPDPADVLTDAPAGTPTLFDPIPEEARGVFEERPADAEPDEVIGELTYAPDAQPLSE